MTTLPPKEPDGRGATSFGGGKRLRQMAPHYINQGFIRRLKHEAAVNKEPPRQVASDAEAFSQLYIGLNRVQHFRRLQVPPPAAYVNANAPGQSFELRHRYAPNIAVEKAVTSAARISLGQ